MLAYSFLATDPKEMLDVDSLKAYRQEVEKRDANGIIASSIMLLQIYWTNFSL